MVERLVGAQVRRFRPTVREPGGLEAAGTLFRLPSVVVADADQRRLLTDSERLVDVGWLPLLDEEVPSVDSRHVGTHPARCSAGRLPDVTVSVLSLRDAACRTCRSARSSRRSTAPHDVATGVAGIADPVRRGGDITNFVCVKMLDRLLL